MRSKGSQAALTLIFILFGFMLATQFRVNPQLSDNVPYQRAEELTVLLKVAEDERDQLQKEVTSLRDRVAEMMAGEDQMKGLEQELSKARILAGLVDVKGPGLIVEMTDSQKPSAPGQDPNAFIIHDDDVLAVVNELFAAGAEAVSVNGQRLVSKTEIRCVGSVFMVNGVRIAPPLEIKAIGDPDTLDSALKMRGGVIETLKPWGIEITTKKETEIVVPAYAGSLEFRYATPVKKEGS